MLAKQITSASGNGTISCTTYNGTKAVGTKEVTFKAVVPNTTKFQPTVSKFNVTPDGKLPAVFDGMYIQGQTGVRADFTASSTYSSVSSYKLTVDGRNSTGNPAISVPLTKDGDFTVTGTVTDKRGFYTTATEDITVIPYREPSIEPAKGQSSVICNRCNQDGTYDDAGVWLHIKCKRKYYSVKGKNTCDLKYQYRAEGGGWSTEKTLSPNDKDDVDGYDYVLTDVVSQTDKSYTIRLIVEDTIGSKVGYEFSISTADVTLHLGIGGYGVGVGKYSEATPDNKMFEVAEDWDIVVYGDRWVDLGISSSVSTPNYDYGRVPPGKCCYRVENGNHVYVAANVKFDYKGEALSIGGAKIPSEYCPRTTVFASCPCNGKVNARFAVAPSGTVYVSFVQNLVSSTETTSKSVLWFDGYIDYFI